MTPCIRGVVAGIVLLTVVGCGGPARKGPPMYPLSGTVTYDGKPVARGSIELVPSEGGSTIANIQDGKYQTPDDRGVVGGPTQVTIYGFDGVPVAAPEGGMDENGTALFPPFKTSIELPKAAATHDFDIPAKK